MSNQTDNASEVERLRGVLCEVRDALKYADLSDTPEFRLRKLLEAERGRCTGDNRMYWHYVLGKLVAAEKSVVAALSAPVPSDINAELLAALEPFAAYADLWDDRWPDESLMNRPWLDGQPIPTLKHCRIARAAIAKARAARGEGEGK